MSGLALKDVSKRFGLTPVLDRVSLKLSDDALRSVAPYVGDGKYKP